MSESFKWEPVNPHNFLKEGLDAYTLMTPNEDVISTFQHYKNRGGLHRVLNHVTTTKRKCIIIQHAVKYPLILYLIWIQKADKKEKWIENVIIYKLANRTGQWLSKYSRLIIYIGNIKANSKFIISKCWGLYSSFIFEHLLMPSNMGTLVCSNLGS